MNRAFYTRDEFLAAARHQRAALLHEQQVASHYATVHQQRRAELGRSYAQATRDLAHALLPRLTPEDLSRAVELTGYARLVEGDPLGRMRRERDELLARVAGIESDVRFAQRELLRHPTTGSLMTALREIDGYRAPFASILARAQHPRMARLLESGYGTPEYATGFWRMSYYEDWKAGDEVLARFPESKFFSEVRAEVLRAMEAIGPLDAEAARLRAEIAAGEALEREHAARRDALATLEARWAHQLRQLVTSFVLECPLEAIAPRLARSPEVELLYKRVTGIIHKTRYLDGIVAQTVERARQEAGVAVAKLDRHIAKYRRPKNAYAQIPAAQFEQRFRDRRAAHQKRWTRFERTYGVVYGYDRYHEVQLARDLLWWDVMTGGRIDGSFLPEVHHFHQTHPHYSYAESRDELEGDTLGDDREADAAAELAGGDAHDDSVTTGDVS